MNMLEEPSDQGIRLRTTDLSHYQALAKKLRFPLQNVPSTFLQGNKQAKIKGRGMTFTDLRQYERGDDIRLIDWRVTARLGTPHTRQYDEDKSQPFFVFVDIAESLFFGSKTQLKSVLAAKVAATTLWQIHLQGEPASLLTCKRGELSYTAPSLSERHLHKCLLHLTQVSQPPTDLEPDAAEQRNEDLLKTLQLLNRHLQSGSIVIIISDFIHWPDSMLDLCHRINAKGQLLFYQIEDPIESNQARATKNSLSLFFTDGNSMQKRRLDSAQHIDDTFLDTPSLSHYHQVKVSTHLPLRSQLLRRKT